MEITMNNKKEIKEFKQLNLNNNNDITDQFIDCEIIRLKNEIIQLEDNLLITNQSNNIEKIKNEIQKNKIKLKTLRHNQRRLKQ